MNVSVRLLSAADVPELFRFCDSVGDSGVGDPTKQWLSTKMSYEGQAFVIAGAFLNEELVAIKVGSTFGAYLNLKQNFPSWLVAWSRAHPDVPVSRDVWAQLADTVEEHFRNLGYKTFYLATEWSANSLSPERKVQAIKKLYNIESYTAELVKVVDEPLTPEQATQVPRVVAALTKFVKRYPVVVLRLSKE